MKKIVIAGIILSTFICLAAAAFAQDDNSYTDDKQVERTFRIALTLFLTQPENGPFTQEEILTMMDFYLGSESVSNVACPAETKALYERAFANAREVPAGIYALVVGTETCDSCDSGITPCGESNLEGQKCLCDDSNGDGEFDDCYLNPMFHEPCFGEVNCGDNKGCHDSSMDPNICAEDYCKDGVEYGYFCQDNKCVTDSKLVCLSGECEAPVEHAKGVWFSHKCSGNAPTPGPTPTPNPTPKRCDDTGTCSGTPGCIGVNTAGDCLFNFCQNGLQTNYVCNSNDECVPEKAQCPSGVCEDYVPGKDYAFQCSGSGPGPNPTPNPSTCSGTGYECRARYVTDPQSQACTSVGGEPVWEYVGFGAEAGCTNRYYPVCCRDPNVPNPNPTPGSDKCFDSDMGTNPTLAGKCSKGTSSLMDSCFDDKSINEAYCNGGENGICAYTGSPGIACPANTVCKDGPNGDACVPTNPKIMNLHMTWPKDNYKTCEATAGGDKDLNVKALDVNLQNIPNVVITLSPSDQTVLMPYYERMTTVYGGAWFRFRAPFATGHDAPFIIKMNANGKEVDPASYAPATASQDMTITPRELIFKEGITRESTSEDSLLHPCDKVKFKACVQAKDPAEDDLVIDYPTAKAITITFTISVPGKDPQSLECAITDKTGCCKTEDWVVPEDITKDTDVSVKATAKSQCYMETKTPAAYTCKVTPVQLKVTIGGQPNPVKTNSPYTLGAIVLDDKGKPIEGVQVTGENGVTGVCNTDATGGCKISWFSLDKEEVVSITGTAAKKCYVSDKFSITETVTK